MWRIYLKIAPHFVHVFSMSRALLDRDGVINDGATRTIECRSERLPIRGSLGAIARHNRAGRSIAICRNQTGVAQGHFSQIDLDATHRRRLAAMARMRGRVVGLCAISRATVEQCVWRNPPPGPPSRAMRELKRTPDVIAVMRDSLRDRESALAAGCLPALVRTGNGANSDAPARALGVIRVLDDVSLAMDRLVTQ